MKKILMEAYLKNLNQIEISLHKDYLQSNNDNFYLYENNILIKELKIVSILETNNHRRFILENLPHMEIGKEYLIQDDKCLFCSVDCSLLLQYQFQNDYIFDGEMGAIYSKEETTFRVFAPLSTSCILELYHDDKKEIYLMNKDIKTGIFSITLKGDYEYYKYLYLLKTNNNLVEAIDIYAKSLTPNSLFGVVVDIHKDKINFNDDKLKDIHSHVEDVIYELSVRDFTSCFNTNIENKGKFLGLSEENKITTAFHPAGLDYLKYLGISHVQLMPVTDFITINDLMIEKTYNWGYDPNIYTSLEGSYSTDPNNPYKRISEFKQLISSLHKNNIRVVMDMVFNHQFIKEYSNFEKLAPNYYFRFSDNFVLSNGSFCGNEIESRHYMARKYIVDTCLYYVKEFHVDGFRFDLMGLTDIDTIKEIYYKCKLIRKDFILYGEGWDMPTSLSVDKRCTQKNAFKIPEIGFFNDRYRDYAKGKSSDNELYIRGYLLGDGNYFDPFINGFLSSSHALNLPPLYDNPSQSINYFECHDNATLFDKLLISNSFENEELKLKRINLINATLIFSYGVCFLHSGQEIGLSKNGVYNSYNSGDKINGFNYEILDSRFSMAKYVKEAISLKKSFECFNISSKDEIKDRVNFINYYSRAIIKIQHAEPYEEIIIIINPFDAQINYDLGAYYKVLFNEFGKLDKGYYVQNVMINAVSILVLAKEKLN